MHSAEGHLGDESSGRPDDGDTEKADLWPARHNRVLTVVAACTTPVIYLIFVGHYGVNVPEVDDWTSVPLIHSALHSHLSLGALWAQYEEYRLFVANLIFVAFGAFDHFDTRTVMFFNAALFIVTVWLFLAIFRAYRRSSPSALSVLLMGVIWFSFADVQNALWAFQSAWYLVVFFFIVMSYLLLVSRRSRNVVLLLAMLAAIAASFSTTEGFVLWPVGLISLVWDRPWLRRTFHECAAWTGVGAITAALFSIGFNFNDNPCLRGVNCTVSYSLHHPVTMGRFFLALVGNVVPSGYWGSLLAPTTNVRSKELLGVLLVLAASFVLVQSIRERRTRPRLPLPVLLITFAVLFDFTIVLGRTAYGPNSVLQDNRYVMPNLLLLLGIVIYALVHIRFRKRAPVDDWWRFYLRWSAVAVLGIFLICQVVIATGFGIKNGGLSERIEVGQARVVVNLDRMPRSAWGCELEDAMWLDTRNQSTVVAVSLPLLAEARADQLSLFEPRLYRMLQAAGPLPLAPACAGHRPPAGRE